jgi:hypothetical protein
LDHLLVWVLSIQMALWSYWFATFGYELLLVWLLHLFAP